MRIVRIKELQRKIGLSRSSIYEKMNEKSCSYDPEFPKPVKIGINAIGWIEDSVDAWIQGKIDH